ncbi:MAG: hypothetical protein LLF89_00950 [Spirochaetaceae bacterium]|nr:hypothetical protein [Spirochaetaceae bacterium]
MKANKLFLVTLLLITGLVFSVHAVTMDGLVTEGEYSRQESFDKGNFKLLWLIEGDKIYFAIDAKAKGWVSIGFDPGTVMSNCDMVFGLVGEPGSVEALDTWSTGIFGPHPVDTDQGGKNDILSYAGNRDGDHVVFEFCRLLNTGDPRDKVIPTSGTLKVVWAYADKLQFTTKHSKAGSAKINIGVTK